MKMNKILLEENKLLRELSQGFMETFTKTSMLCNMYAIYYINIMISIKETLINFF